MPLHGLRVLVVEDDWFLATTMEGLLRAAHATVVGPVPSVEAGLDLLAHGPHLDAALLDVNLGGEMVYPLADRLVAEGVPVVFATAYSAGVLPRRFTALPHLEKPVAGTEAVQAVARAAHRG